MVRVDAVRRLEALAHHAFTEPQFVQQIHGALLENAGADTLLDILLGLGFENDTLNPGTMHEMSEHEARWACTDDGDLGLHECGSLVARILSPRCGEGPVTGGVSPATHVEACTREIDRGGYYATPVVFGKCAETIEKNKE